MPKPKKAKFKRSIGVGETPGRDIGKGPKAARQLLREGWRGSGSNSREGEVLHPPGTKGNVGSQPQKRLVTKPIQVVQKAAATPNPKKNVLTGKRKG